jgi:ubiquinone/menaquinone biosynthesis C-methylase UbiE
MLQDPANTQLPSPERIVTMLNAFQQSAILKGAIELDVFSKIAAGHNSAPVLAGQCRADEHGTEVLCDSLVVMGLLEKSAGLYRLSADAAMFLDRRSPMYMGDITSFLLAPEMIANWSEVAAVVRRGGPDGLATVAREHPIWLDFAKGMASFLAPTAKKLASLVTSGGLPTRVLDLAAGHGLFGIEIAKLAPDSRIVALDWPKVLEVAQHNANAAGIADRWEALPGSAFDVPFGAGYDVVLLLNFLHHFDPGMCEGLLRKIHGALLPGGRVVTLEFIPNEDGVSPPFAALFAMMMLISTPKGRAYRYSELEAMHHAAGFEGCKLIELPPTPQRVVIARKTL